MEEEIKKIFIEKSDELRMMVTILLKNVWNVKELAKVLEITEGRVRRMACNGEIKHYKRGKQLYFKREEVEQWMTQTERPSKEAYKQMAATFSCIKQLS